MPNPTFVPIPFSSPSFAPFGSLAAPPGLKVSEDGKSLTMDCEGGRDWWRVPFEYHGEPGKGKMKPRDDKNGPAWGFGRKVGQEGFEVRCELGVDAKVQAQLLFYLSPTEWVKVGVEYDNDALWCGVVVCNPYSDWSIQPPPPSDIPTVFTISYDPCTTTLRVYLNDTMMREVKSFGLHSAGYGDGRLAEEKGEEENKRSPGEALKDKEAWVGVMACSPLGSTQEGERAGARFKGLEIRDGTR